MYTEIEAGICVNNPSFKQREIVIKNKDTGQRRDDLCNVRDVGPTLNE